MLTHLSSPAVTSGDHCGESATHRRFRLGTRGFPRWAPGAPHRLIWSSLVSGTWQLHAADLTSGATRQVTHVPVGVTDGAIDPLGRCIWWFTGHGGSERGTWFRQPFPGGAVRDVGLPAAFSTGLILTRHCAIVGSSSPVGTTIRLLPPEGTTVVVRRCTSHVELGEGSADGSLFTISRFGAGPESAAAAVLDLTGTCLADSVARPGTGLIPGSWSPVPGDQRLLVHLQGDDIARPAIWSPLPDAFRPLDIDLEGVLTCRWYPDAAAVLVTRESAGRSTLHRHDLDTSRLEEIPFVRRVLGEVEP